LKADLASPTFTGTPAAPTASAGNNSTQIATTAYVDAAVTGGVAGVASLNGQTGALAFIAPPQGRLTLATGVPVMKVTQSAKTTIYYTPYVGNQIPIYDGTNMVPKAFAEISVATTDTAKNPAAIGASKVNDWFVWNDSGTMRLSHGPDWTDDTTRSAGTALVMVNGIYLNNASITNGPAASRGTYVGTTRSNSSSQLDWIFGSIASGGGAAFLNVWNAYNRADVTTTVSESGSSWSYSTATVRPSNNSTSNRISCVSGLAEDGISAALSQRIATATSLTAVGTIGFVLDDTANITYSAIGVSPANGSAFNGQITAQGSISPQLGYHFLQAVEKGDGSTTTFVGGGAGYQLSARLRM
jgi:hypothetical protein